MLKIEARQLRPAAIPALAATLGLLAVLATHWSQRESASLREARAQVQRRLQDEAAAATRHHHAQLVHARMQAWVRRGLFEPPDRFRWIAAVGRARGAAQLPTVDYEFTAAASTARQVDAAPASVGPRISDTRLTLRVGLTQEAQLLTFLRALEAEPGGALRVRSCEIKRLAEVSVPSVALDAQCELSVLNAEPSDKT